ncbi:MAG TPA: insulinase family protein [Vicinamibacterales bacterium]
MNAISIVLRKRAWFGLCLAIVLTSLGGAAAQDRPAPPPAQSIALDQPVPVDPRITIGYLPNGLRYYVRANARPFQRAELRLVVNIGSVVEDQDQRGIAHFVEHMAFNGSEHFAKQDLIQFMESIGMRLGPGVNANTSFDETVYVLHVPTDKPEAMRKAFLFFADVAHGLSFDADAIEKERGVIIEEWRQGRGAAARMQDEQVPVLLKGSRYAERNPIGGRENIERVTPESMKRFYKDWYRPDLMAVIAVGDFNKADVERMIRDQFGSIPVPDQRKPRPAFDVPDHPDTLFSLATDPEATMTTVALYNVLPLREQATVGAYRQHQVERLYTGMLNARLAELTLKPDPPFMRAGIERGIFVRTKEAASMMALVKEDGISRGLAALVTESARAARFGFTAGELERERRDVLRGYESAFAERDKEESADLASEFIRAFTQQEPTPGMTYEYGLVQRFLPAITIDEVNKVAKDWTSGSRVVLANAPKKPGLTVPDSTQLAAAMKSASEADIKPYVDVAGTQSLMNRLPEPGSVLESTMKGRLGLTEWKLSNGVKVVLMPTTFKQDEVVFRATSPGGTSLASDKDYVAAMTAAQVVGAGGVGPFNVIQLRNALAGKAVSVSAFINDEEEGLGGGASPKDLETMFQLIYLTFTQPRADAAAFASMTSQMKAMLANQQASPDWSFQETLTTTLAQNHYRARPMTPAMVDEMDLQRSFAFYKDRFADASDFTFVFAGSFDYATIRPLVERYLGSLPSLGRRETWKDEGITPPRGVVEKVVRKGIEPKSQAAIVFTGAFPFDSPHEVALDALGIVLEGRLRRSLREALRGTYGVGVEASASKIPEPRYSITVQFGCDPDRTEELVTTLFREVERLKAQGPTEAEVADVRQALMVAFQTDMAENSRLVAKIIERYELSQDVMEFFDLPGEYQKLNTITIQDAARRYLDAGNHVRVTLFPETAAGAKK